VVRRDDSATKSRARGTHAGAGTRPNGSHMGKCNGKWRNSMLHVASQHSRHPSLRSAVEAVCLGWRTRGQFVAHKQCPGASNTARDHEADTRLTITKRHQRVTWGGVRIYGKCDQKSRNTVGSMLPQPFATLVGRRRDSHRQNTHHAPQAAPTTQNTDKALDKSD
jgi:hypothetical protein